jgi:hypothetical protein
MASANARLFEDSWQRLDRAMMHAQVFTDEWHKLLKPEAFETRSKQKGDGAVVLVGRFRKIPKNDLALELGEFFYQLRAALDGLIFKTAEIKSAPDPPADENRLEFPIYDTAGRFENSAVYKGPFPDELKTWLQSVQPYNAPYSSDPNAVEYGRILKLLHDCARKDRHRKLHILAAVPVRVDWNFDPPLPAMQVQQLDANFFEDEAEFLELRLRECDWKNSNVKFKGEVALNISVGEMPGLVGQAVSDEMNGLLRAVQLIVRDFEVAFK